jgi:hypothetical protein
MDRIIDDDLVATLGEEAIAYSIVRKYLRETQTSPDDPEASRRDYIKAWLKKAWKFRCNHTPSQVGNIC